MKKAIDLNNGLTNEEKLRVAVLRRLNETGIVLPCSSFGIGLSKLGSKDKFKVGFVVRNEFTNTDTPVTVTLHKGVSAKEATEALHCVIGVIKKAERSARLDKKNKVTRGTVGSYLVSLVVVIFDLPGNGLKKLIDYVNRKI